MISNIAGTIWEFVNQHPNLTIVGSLVVVFLIVLVISIRGADKYYEVIETEEEYDRHLGI